MKKTLRWILKWLMFPIIIFTFMIIDLNFFKMNRIEYLIVMLSFLLIAILTALDGLFEFKDAIEDISKSTHETFESIDKQVDSLVGKLKETIKERDALQLEVEALKKKLKKPKK